MLQLGRGAWAATLAQLRDHGQGQNECVVYWSASQDQLSVADRVVHPEHTATPWHYAPTQEWLNEFFVSLVRERRSVVAQVHTHKTIACHSPTDDKGALVHVPGFLSLVVPDFAMRTPRLDRIYLAEVAPDGTWQEVAPTDRISGFQE